MTDLSVVIPVYNEGEAIEALVDDLGRELPRIVAGFEVIMVDDCSTDETPVILDRLAGSRPWLHVYHAECNAGHGPSVVRGLDLSRSDWVFQIDSDGQFVVAELSHLWEHRNEADLVLGVRADRNDPAHRIVLSRAVMVAVSLLAGRRIRDANTPFRLLRRTVWDDLRPLIGDASLAPNVFVTVGAAAGHWRIVDVAVTHLARETGVVSLRALRLLKFSSRGLGQLLGFRYRLARAPRRRT